MKAKIVYLALALALVFSLAAVMVPATLVGAVLPNEVWVDDGTCPNTGSGTQVDPYCKIQDGIDNVAPGGTVHVLDGTYNENLVVNKALTLQAASSPIIDGSSTLTNPAVHIQADNVTVEGFTIQNFIATKAGAPSDVGAILVEGNNAKIKDNVVRNITCASAVSGECPAGLGIDVRANDVELIRNDIYDISSIGIRVWHDWITPPITSNNILIEDNTVYHTGNSGVVITGYARGVTIKGNEIYESLEPTPYNLFVHYGASDITIGGEGNYIHDAYANIVLAGCDNVAIKDNIVEDATPLPSDSGVKGKNIYILNDYLPWYNVNALSTNVDIVGNEIRNADGWGIRIRNIGADDPSQMAATTTINWNNIVGNTLYGVENQIATDVDATNNWWGDASGPYHPSTSTDCMPPSGGGWNCDVCDENSDGAGDKVSNSVDYCRWLMAPVGEAESETIDGSGTITDTPTGGDVTIDATGDHTVTVATYTSNPGGATPFASSGNFWDVHLSDDTNVNSLTIEFCPGGSGIYYWDGASWALCSHQGYSDGCIEVYIDNATPTHPSLDDLSGQGFGSSLPVGGEVYPVNRLAVLAPWIALAMLLIGGVTWLTLRRWGAQG